MLPRFITFCTGFSLASRACAAGCLLLLLIGGCAAPPRIAEGPYRTPLARFRYSCQPLDSLTVAAALPELEERFGEHLEATVYRDKLLAALSFYPDLRGVKIRLIQRRLRTSMAARPLGLGRRRGRRTYAVYVDDLGSKPADFRQASYAAQVGCFIHELGHIRYYVNRSNARLAADGLSYITSQRFKNRYERIADSLAIRNGGGYYAYLYRTFTFEEAELPAAYLAFKRRNYTGNKALLAKHIAYLRENSVDKCTDF